MTCNINLYSKINMLRIDFLAYLMVLSLLTLSLPAIAQQQEEEQEQEQEEYYEEKYDRRNKGRIIQDNEQNNPYDRYRSMENIKRHRAEENTGFGSSGGIGMPNFGKSDDDAVQTNAEKLLQEQGETHNFTDPSKANAEVTPKESDGEQTPSLPSDPDLPIDTGLYYAFAAGLLYCSRKLYEIKKAA
jgi:hypothetical protein